MPITLTIPGANGADPRTITFDPEPPASYAERTDIVSADLPSFQRQLAAALGSCWPAGLKWPGPRRPSFARAKYDVARFGGDVLDQLVALGVSPTEISAAATACFNAIADSVFGQQDLDAAEDFSGPPGEESTA